PNAAQMKQGDAVLVWGATGGIGGYGVQYVLEGGGIPVGVVSSPEKVALLHDLGVEHVIDRREAGYRFWADEHTQDESEWRRLGKDIRSMIGRDVDIVFEHPGRQTFGASVYVAARGGTIVTCAATSGFMIEFDNRHLWMKLKRIISSHFANYAEAWAANQAICEGRIQPILSAVHPLDQVGEAAYQVHHNLHEGKIGVLCLAPAEGMGIDDPEFRAQIGEDPDIVFEHPGRSTFAASMYVVKKGGTVVTCAATSGFMMEFDNRYFWMRLKRLVGSHFANYREAWEANRLIAKGMIHPVMSQVFPLEQTGEAAYQVHHNMHEGKLGVLCLSPEEGLGVDNHELRAKVADKLTWFRR
ncbi:MAG: zinc-binding dehydrogenase, partial [Actinomycetota bacterium]